MEKKGMEYKKNITLDMALNKYSGRIEKGYVLAAFTDEYYVAEWPEDKRSWVPEDYRNAGRHIVDNGNKLMELRIFSSDGLYNKRVGRELKLVRSDISREFKLRYIDDEEYKGDYFDERQKLDIDINASKALRDDRGNNDEEQDNAFLVQATGGGRYFLPLKGLKNAHIVIRYYLGKYEETGQARVEDWRVVGFGRDPE